MTTQSLIDILKSLVIASSESANGRLNSFAVIAAYQDLQKENFGASVRSGAIGNYWSRTWDASGQSESAVCAEFGLLYVWPRETGTFNSCKDQYRHRIIIGVVNAANCADCQTKYSEFEAEQAAAYQLRAVLMELSKYRLYKGVTIGGVLGDYWMLPSEAATHNVPNLSVCEKAPCGDFEIRLNTYGANDLRVAFTEIETLECGTEPTFDYEIKPSSTQVGAVRCNHC